MEVLMMFSGGLDIIPVLLGMYLIYYIHKLRGNYGNFKAIAITFVG